MKKCQLCKKETEELFNLFGNMVCQSCLDKYEEGKDKSDLYDITDRRGKEWVSERLNELVSIETIK